MKEKIKIKLRPAEIERRQRFANEMIEYCEENPDSTWAQYVDVFRNVFNRDYVEIDLQSDAAFYKEYIASPEWKARADAAKERAGYRCEICNSPDRLQAHHRTYERLGDELPEDLTVLCDKCHELFSKNGRLKK